MLSTKLLFNKIPRRQTKFQNENFVIRKNGITLYGKYKQSIRELKSRIDRLVQISFDIMETKENLQTLTGIKYKREQWKLKQLISDREELKAEIIEFYMHALNIYQVIDTEDIEELEKEHWLAKAIILSKVDLLTFGKLSKPTLEFVISLPKEIKDKYFKLLEDEYRKNSKLSLKETLSLTD